MIDSILKGNAVVVCGHDAVTPIVVVLVCLIRAYRVTVLEAFLVLRQKSLVASIDPRILAAIQTWRSKDGTVSAPVKPSQNQYGCFCAESMIKLTVTGINEQVRPCACEVEQTDTLSIGYWPVSDMRSSVLDQR